MEQKARVSRLERALETSDQAVQRIQFGVGSLLALVTLCALLFFALRGDDQESFSTAVAVKSHNLVVKRQENEIVIKISCTLRNDGASAELLSASNGKLDFFHAGYDQTYWFSLYDRDGIREEWITINIAFARPSALNIGIGNRGITKNRFIAILPDNIVSY
jgi:hypothetical protein